MGEAVNEALLNKAAELIDYWEGTLYADEMRKAIEDSDLEQLFQLVRTADYEMYQKEYNPNEAEDIY